MSHALYVNMNITKYYYYNFCTSALIWSVGSYETA